jgi:hypothetical protein
MAQVLVKIEQFNYVLTDSLTGDMAQAVLYIDLGTIKAADNW